jgi:alkylation response protein AidB-like acyl-CoA dehydrogenase
VSAPAVSVPRPAAEASAAGAATAAALRPRVARIDGEGEYPRDLLRDLGAAGGFRQAVPAELGGAGAGVAGTLAVIEEVATECTSTAFCVWCQAVCAWYVQHAEPTAATRAALAGIVSGEVTAGTALSNAMKHAAGIEPLRITATPVRGGHRLDGVVPWLSNIEPDGWFGAVAAVDGEAIVTLVPAGAPGVELGAAGPFVALEGSSTYSARLDGVLVPDDLVLARPAAPWLETVRAGFVLTQCGMGLGLVRACVAQMRASNRGKGHVNRYLPDGPDPIERALVALRDRVDALAGAVGCGGQPPPRGTFAAVVEVRLAVAELALRAAQAGMLHAGATGYRRGSPAERRVREAFFVAIVTPGVKHLRKLLLELPDGSRSAPCAQEEPT